MDNGLDYSSLLMRQSLLFRLSVPLASSHFVFIKLQAGTQIAQNISEFMKASAAFLCMSFFAVYCGMLHSDNEGLGFDYY